MPSTDAETDRALLVAMPLRHLLGARAVQEVQGFAVMPAGGPGALDETPMHTAVLFIALDTGEAQLPAATWGAAFAGRVPHDPEDAWPDALPPSWLDEHPLAVELTATTGSGNRGDGSDSEEGNDDEDDDDVMGPQSFFRVSALAPLPRSEWVFTNELVPKQQRRGRSFLPRTPTLISRPG